MFATRYARRRVEEMNWHACKRSLFSQTGVGALVSLFTTITLLSGVAPKKYIDRHIVKPNKIVTMDLNLEEVRGMFVRSDERSEPQRSCLCRQKCAEKATASLRRYVLTLHIDIP